MKKDLLRPLKDRIESIESRMRAILHTQWGIVAVTNPLQVQLDGDPAPIAGTPATVVPGLSTGDRVLCLIQNRRLTVIGRGKGQARSGLLTVGTGTLTQLGSTGIYARTITVTVPAVAPPGHTIVIHPLSVGSGYAQVSQSGQSPGLSSTTCTLRVSQPNSNASQSLQLLWQIVPTT